MQDGELQLVGDASTPTSPQAIEDSLLYSGPGSEGRERIERAHPDGTAELYIAPPDAYASFVHTDGEWITWLQGRDPIDSSTHWARRTIKAARYTEDPADLEPQPRAR